MARETLSGTVLGVRATGEFFTVSAVRSDGPDAHFTVPLYVMLSSLPHPGDLIVVSVSWGQKGRVDCGVETPEAAVEAALREAESILSHVDDEAAHAILALLIRAVRDRAQGWTPPGGTE